MPEEPEQLSLYELLDSLAPHEAAQEIKKILEPTAPTVPKTVFHVHVRGATIWVSLRKESAYATATTVKESKHQIMGCRKHAVEALALSIGQRLCAKYTEGKNQ